MSYSQTRLQPQVTSTSTRRSVPLRLATLWTCAVLLWAGAPATPASGQASGPEQACLRPGSDQAADLGARIESCSRVASDMRLRAAVRAEAHLRRGLAYAQRAQQTNDKDDIDRAISDLSNGLRLDDTTAARIFVFQNRAGLHYYKGEYDLALSDYSHLLSLLPNTAAIYGHRGAVYAAKGEHERAIADFSQAIRLEPGSTQYLGERALSYLQIGKKEQALADANKVVALDPGNAASYGTRVVINKALGKSEQVADDLRKALALEPSNEGIRTELALVRGEAPATAPADLQTAARRDYELALQAGDRDAWEAYLRIYREGFYAELARAQLKKITPEKSFAAEQEKARQAEAAKVEAAKAEAAKAEAAKAEATKAAAAAKAAEDARIAAEKAKQIEEARAAAAEKARLAEQEKARLAAEKARQIEQEKAAAAEKTRLAEEEKARVAADKARQAEQEKTAAAEKVRLAAEKAAEEKKQQLAAVSSDKPEQGAIDLPRALQAELRRVGCNSGTVDGNWNTASQKSLDLFNKHAGMKLDVNTASADALDAVKGKTGRVCPLICDTGFRADGERCVKITCRAGYEVGDDGKCEKIEVRKRPVAKRQEPSEPRSRRNAQEPSRSQSTGQYQECDSNGCRPTREKPPPGQTTTIYLR